MTDTPTTDPMADGDVPEQLQPEDTLIDRGVDDALDEGYITPDGWSPLQGFGNTPAEMREGERIEQRIKQEVPETPSDDRPWNPEHEDRQVGKRRAGRLVDARDGSGEVFGAELGIDGGVASAEEAAMHIIDEDDEDDLDD